MKRNILYSIFFLLPIAGYGQTIQRENPANGPSKFKNSGSPSSLNVTMPMNQLIQFTNANELNSGKTYPGFYKVTVSSEVSWVVSVMAKSPFFSSSSPDLSENLPASILSLKESTMADYVNLSVVPQNILFGDNSRVISSFNIDMKVNPSWNYRGGSYSQEIIFTLSPQ